MVETYAKGIETKFLFWLQNGKIQRTIIDYASKSVRSFDENGNLIMIRRGLTVQKMNEIEKTIKKYKFEKEKIIYYFGGI
jgi:hypothetical protein